MGKDKLSSRFIIQKTELIETKVEDIIEEVPRKDIHEIIKSLKDPLALKIESIPVWFEYSCEQKKELIKNFVENNISDENLQIDEINQIIELLNDSIRGFGVLQPILDDNNVFSITINGTRSIYVNGQNLLSDFKLTNSQLKILLNFLGSISGTDLSKGINKFKTDKYIITVIANDICKSGVNINIRKIHSQNIEELINKKYFNKEISDFLISVVSQRKNIIISGSVNSGKSTLIDALINSILQDKQVYLIEKEQSISCKSENITQFIHNDNYNSQLFSYVLKIEPEYIVTDLNNSTSYFSGLRGLIQTMNTDSPESALKNLISMYMGSGLPEKFAKTKALSEFDYIVHISNFKVASIMELVPAKTMHLSVKTIAHLVDGQYVSHIPQPITSIVADSLTSEKISKRFKK